MSGVTVRISESARETLKEISSRSGESMQAVLEKAVEVYRRQTFLEALHKDFLTLREDPAAWDEERKERMEWELPLGDDLDSQGNE